MNRFASIVAGLSLAFIGTSTTIAATINVPSDYATIQEAIDASVTGDVINIAAGTYYEHSISPGGKAITIQGTTTVAGFPTSIIDAEQQDVSVFVINSGEGSDTVIADLGITGGYTSSNGGGIRIGNNCSPTISGCWIYGNTVTGNNKQGGGINGGEDVNATISNCVISGNTAFSRGGGIAMGRRSNPTISDCTITGNYAASGGGLFFILNDAVITGCTISDNIGIYLGGALSDDGSTINMTGCTISGNVTEIDAGLPAGIYFPDDTIMNISQSTICGNTQPYGASQISDGYTAVDSCIQDECSVFCSATTTTPGDVDGDGDVDTDDLSSLRSTLSLCASDTDMDGDTDIEDLLNVVAGWGTTCP